MIGDNDTLSIGFYIFIRYILPGCWKYLSKEQEQIKTIQILIDHVCH